MEKTPSNVPDGGSFFDVVEAILGDPKLRNKISQQFPKLYSLLEEYRRTYKERERYAQLLRDIEMKLKDPVLGIEEELRLKVKTSRIKNYIEFLNFRLEELEEEIFSHPKFPQLIPEKPLRAGAITLARPAKRCEDFEKLLTILESIQNAVEPHLQQFGRPQLIADLGFFCYTDHGINHVQRVLKNSEAILSDLGVELNEIEDSLLKIAAYYHDHALNNLPPKLDLENVRDIDEVRKRHAQLGRERWERDFNEIYMGQLKKYLSQQDLQKIKNSVAYIIDNHSGDFHKSKDFKIKICNKEYSIRVTLLSAVLRIADEIDMGYQRLPCPETMNLCIALGSCYRKYSKSIPHYITNGIVDYVEIKDHVITVSLHPFGEIVAFYPNVANNSLFIAYNRESYETLPVVLRENIKNVIFIEEELSNKLKKELDLVNDIFSEYGFPELQYELEELYPVDIISKIDREIIIKGIKSLLNSPEGRNVLAKCRFVEKLKAPQDIYTILKTR